MYLPTNIPSKVIGYNVIPSDEVSDHDTPFIVVNIRKERFEPRYKILRDEKNFDLQAYTRDFSELLLNLVNAFADPNDQIDILNKLPTTCTDKHAPSKQ